MKWLRERHCRYDVELLVFLTCCLVVFIGWKTAGGGGAEWQPPMVSEFVLNDGTRCVELKKQQSIAIDCDWRETPR